MAAITNPFPGVWHDGDYSQPAAVGLPRFKAPFADEGDPAFYVMEIPYWQSADTYKTPAEGSISINGYQFTADADYRDESAGIISFTREFVKKPRSRSVGGGSYSYTFQFEQIEGGSAQLGEITLTTPSRLQKDYFYAPGDKYYQIPRIWETKLMLLGNAFFTLPFGYPWPPVPNENGEIVAVSGIPAQWKGNFYERVTRYVPAQVLTPFTP